MADEAIPAATLIVVRDCASGPPELLMVERSGGMAFAPGALVFPGGRIDELDRSLGDGDAAKVAAIRETIEETAIPVGIAPLPHAGAAKALQADLLGDRDFGQLLSSRGLSLDLGALSPFARWVPKFHAVRRFDTMFFIARSPPGDWLPQVVTGECAGAKWLGADAALKLADEGVERLIFPTRRTLERIAQHASFDEIHSDAMGHAIEAVTPWIEEKDGEKYITIPDHLGFPVTEERLDGLWRG